MARPVWTSPYVGMGNDWAEKVDPDGGLDSGIFGKWVEKTVNVAATTLDVGYSFTQLVWQASNFAKCATAGSTASAIFRGSRDKPET